MIRLKKLLIANDAQKSDDRKVIGRVCIELAIPIPIIATLVDK